MATFVATGGGGPDVAEADAVPEATIGSLPSGVATATGVDHKASGATPEAVGTPVGANAVGADGTAEMPVTAPDRPAAAVARDGPSAGGSAASVTAADELEAIRQLLAEASALRAPDGGADVPADRRGAASGERSGATPPTGEETSGGEGPADGDEASLRALRVALSALSASIRFPDRSTALGQGATLSLDEVSAALARRPDVAVTVEVAGNEYRDEARDRVLSRERGRAVIAGLVNRGVAFERLSLEVAGGAALAPDSHRVRVFAATASM